MMKSIRTLVRQDREKYVIPRRVQDVIPIQKIWADGIFLTGGWYAKTFRFTDINYQVASEPDKEKMFRGYSAIINSLVFSQYHEKACISTGIILSAANFPLCIYCVLFSGIVL